MKLIYFIFSLLMLCAQNLVSQEKYSEEYFANLKRELINNPVIEDVFVERDFYKNGQLKKHSFYAKFKTDSVERYFHVGKCSYFHKNGGLAYFHTIDPGALSDADTSVYCNKKGDTVRMYHFVYLNRLNQLIDSSTFLKKELHFVKTGIYTGSYSFYKDSMEINGFPVYQKFYKNIISTDYKNGIKRKFGRYSLDPIGFYYTPNGKHYSYHKDGSLKEVIDYDSLFYKKPELANTAYVLNYELETEDVKYMGSNSKKITDYIDNALEKLKRKKRKVLVFAKGVYVAKGDTVKCHIYEDNTASSGWHNTFFISKNEQGYKVLTAKEVDSYSFNERKYKSICIDEHYYFMQELVNGPVSFYERRAVPTDKSEKYYIIINDLKEVYALGDVFYPISGSRYFDCYLNNHTHYKGQLLTSNNEIRSFLLSLPNISNDLALRIQLSIKFHDLKISNLIRKYNEEQ